MVHKQRSILLVDDEENILNSYARGLKKAFNVVTANSPLKALEILKKAPKPFPVIVSDFNMPQMTGDEFLKSCIEISPNSIRVLLSGKADIDNVINCINQGKIFRFILKPCSLVDMAKTLDDCLHQHDLILSEKVLLGQTLIGTVQICVDFLTIHNPLVFCYVSKLKKHIEELCDLLNIKHKWRYTIAALLSHTGAMLLDAQTLSKIIQTGKLDNEDRIFFEEMLSLSAQMIQTIPRLELTTEIILKHQTTLDEFNIKPTTPILKCPPLVIGSQLLNIIIQFNRFITQNQPIEHIVNEMKKHPDVFHPEIVNALSELSIKIDSIKAKVKVEDLNQKMISTEDFYDKDGNLVLGQGQQLNMIFINKLKTKLRKKQIEPWLEVYITS